MGDKVDLFGEIRRWAHAPTVKISKKIHTALADTGDRVSAQHLKDTGCVRLRSILFSLFHAGDDTGTHVRPLETQFLTLPWHFLTRALVSSP